MESKITLYAYTFRSRAERVIWTLEELQLPYTIKRLNPMLGESRTAEFLALNPSGKVPTLTHGECVLTESIAIMAYLNRLHLEQPLTPKNDPDLFQYEQAMSYAIAEIENYLWIATQQTNLSAFYSWPTGTADYAIKLLRRNLNQVFLWLEQRPYIAGTTFSLADIYYYHLLTWIKHDHHLDLSPATETYLARLRTRPHYPKSMGDKTH